MAQLDALKPLRLLHDFGSVAGSLGAEALRQQCLSVETDLRKGLQRTAAAIAGVATRLLHRLDDACGRSWRPRHSRCRRRRGATH